MVTITFATTLCGVELPAGVISRPKNERVSLLACVFGIDVGRTPRSLVLPAGFGDSALVNANSETKHHSLPHKAA